MTKHKSVPSRAKYEWSQAEVDKARDDMDFDNCFHIKCLNPKAKAEMLRRYLVFGNTTGQMRQSPTWYPRRNLKKKLQTDYKHAEKARKAQRTILQLRKLALSMQNNLSQPGKKQTYGFRR